MTAADASHERSADEIQELLEIAQDAYIWGSPLVQSGEYRRTRDYWYMPINRAYGRLAVLEEDFAPSQEIIYGFIDFDLTSEPQVLTVAPITDRFYSVMFTDSFFNPFTYISTRTNHGRGGVFVITGPGWDGELPAGAVRIDCPNNRILTYLRTGVKNKDDAPQAVAVAASSYKTAPLSGYPDRLQGHFKGRMPIGDYDLFPVYRGDTESIRFFDKLGQELLRTPYPADEAHLAERFARIGVGPGLTPTDGPDKELRQILKRAIPLAQQRIDARTHTHERNNWQFNVGVSAKFDDYELRAALQSLGGGYNIADEAMIFKCYTGPDGEELSGTKRYRFFFPKSALPPVDEFWSFLLLDAAGIPVPNPIRRFAISSGMTDLVYGADGSLDIRVQHEPPDEPGTNWLPSPEGTFQLFGRLYMPRAEARAGRYAPPALEII